MWDSTSTRSGACLHLQTMTRRIEVRYFPERRAWKATLLPEREKSAYGADARDAFEYLCELTQRSPLGWRVLSASKERVVYGEAPSASQDASS